MVLSEIACSRKLPSKGSLDSIGKRQAAQTLAAWFFWHCDKPNTCKCAAAIPYGVRINPCSTFEEST